LTGVNDSGKTRILGLLETALSFPERGDLIDVFGIAAPGEVSMFVHHETDPRFRLDDLTEPAAPFVEALESPAAGDDVRIGVRLSTFDQRFFAWRFGRSLTELDDRLRDELDDVLPAGAHGREPLEPVKLESLGGVDPAIFPEAIVVPATPADVEREVARAVTRLCRALRTVAFAWAQVDVFEEALAAAGGALEGVSEDWVGKYPSDPGEEEDDPSWLWLVEEQPRASVVTPAAFEACAAFGRIASELVPEFISHAYRLEIGPADPASIVRGDPLRIQLLRRDTVPTDTDDAEEAHDWALQFGLAEAASGFTVWLQLALLEAAARIRLLAAILEFGGSCIDAIYVEAGGYELRAWDPDQQAHERTPLAFEGLGLDRIKAMIEDAVKALRDPRLLRSREECFEMIGAELAELRDDPGLDDGLSRALRSRVYLLDEPEQRMHPSLQRHAARWLASAMSEWGCQCVIATHAVAFMDIPGDTRIYELTRSGEEAFIAPVDIAALTPQALLAREMGLDRGELLSRWRAFLFIDSLDATAVLEELFAERLESSRIRVLPLHDHGRGAGLLSLTVLAELTGTPIAVMLVSTPVRQIELLRTADAHTRARAGDDPGEIGTAAKIVDLTLRHEREIEILTVNVPDIFDLLDENTLRQTGTTVPGRPAFPGHEAARNAHQAATNSGTYREFLHQTYGIATGTETIRRIARHMRDAKLPPPQQLDDLILRLDQIALATETATD
jgi:hypothetical protein